MIGANVFFYAVLSFTTGSIWSSVEGKISKRRYMGDNSSDIACDRQELVQLEAEIEALKQQQSGGVSNASEVQHVSGLTSRKRLVQRDINAVLNNVSNTRGSAVYKIIQIVTSSSKRIEAFVTSLDGSVDTAYINFVKEKLNKVYGRKFDGHSECSNWIKVKVDTDYAASKAIETLSTCRYKTPRAKSILELIDKVKDIETDIEMIANAGCDSISKIAEELEGCGNNVTNNPELLRTAARCVDYAQERAAKEFTKVATELNLKANCFVSQLEKNDRDYINNCSSAATSEFYNLVEAKSSLIDECLLSET